MFANLFVLTSAKKNFYDCLIVSVLILSYFVCQTPLLIWKESLNGYKNFGSRFLKHLAILLYPILELNVAMDKFKSKLIFFSLRNLILAGMSEGMFIFQVQ